MTINVGGSIASVLIVVVIFYVLKMEKKYSHMKREAILEYFPDAAKGYRLIVGQGSREYIYVDDKCYSIVFSGNAPYKIVFSEELDHTKIGYMEKKCGDRYRKYRRL
ncbi:hypothetical protein [Clostridium sp. HBUAS56010]|uniref:hypothetical protein n=1 Tax=Clostridium sp. HBUAS56010 TaxID=2571127 RepID=UPI00117844A9|nr:hypothetical protein [Clostridium sp. HBUAS56010]